MEIISSKIFLNTEKNILFQEQHFTECFYKGIEKEEEVIIEKKRKDIYILPKQKDTLFWCFFICAFGYKEYISVERNYGNKEIEVKQKAGVYIKENYQEFKQNSSIRITKSLIEDIVSDFNTQIQSTNFFNFNAMSFMHKINFIILHEEKPCYLSFVVNKESPYYLIQQMKYNKYQVRQDPLTLEEQVKLESTNYCLDSWLRPIRAISTYKVSDLQDIAYSLDLEDIPNMKKQELYDYIVESISWY